MPDLERIHSTVKQATNIACAAAGSLADQTWHTVLIEAVSMKKCIYALLIVLGGLIGSGNEGWRITGNHISINFAQSK
ncbi:hypothetical protein CWS43_16210 [Rahnella sp. AA]|uniref:hypothetical protein n=1 Tax=Rahnella sp. AA TaxID=2057180 RepID=UPI000C3372A3|nr:hypothetical protein [Rahnella sp. AA]PKE29581.1 hypothetical protein CWS43_16210 [Rahnella sp. AA]